MFYLLATYNAPDFFFPRCWDIEMNKEQIDSHTGS